MSSMKVILFCVFVWGFFHLFLKKERIFLLYLEHSPSKYNDKKRDFAKVQSWLVFPIEKKPALPYMYTTFLFSMLKGRITIEDGNSVHKTSKKGIGGSDCRQAVVGFLSLSGSKELCFLNAKATYSTCINYSKDFFPQCSLVEFTHTARNISFQTSVDSLKLGEVSFICLSYVPHQFS